MQEDKGSSAKTADVCIGTDPWCFSPLTKRTEGEGLKSPFCLPPSHHSTSTGSGGPDAAHVRLKGSPANAATSSGSTTKWGTPKIRAGGGNLCSVCTKATRYNLINQLLDGFWSSNWHTFDCNPSRLWGNDPAVIFNLTPVLPGILLLHWFNTKKKETLRTDTL